MFDAEPSQIEIEIEPTSYDFQSANPEVEVCRARQLAVSREVLLTHFPIFVLRSHAPVLGSASSINSVHSLVLWMGAHFDFISSCKSKKKKRLTIYGRTSMV